MRPTGGWNSFAIERVESRKEVCQHILGNDDCFQVPGVFAVRIVRNLWTLGPVSHLRTVVVGILESPPFWHGGTDVLHVHGNHRSHGVILIHSPVQLFSCGCLGVHTYYPQLPGCLG